MTVERGPARLFCPLMSLYYTYHVFCKDKTMRVGVLLGERKEEEDGGGAGGGRGGARVMPAK